MLNYALRIDENKLITAIFISIHIQNYVILTLINHLMTNLVNTNIIIIMLYC